MARPKSNKPKPSTSPDTPVVIESKSDKLTRLASARVPRACRYILMIGNLAAYKPTDSDVDQIMEALGSACASVENRLRGTKKSVEPFSLRRVAS